MKIFLSWSGSRSRAVAETLNDWLRRVIQAVKPFYSPEIEKGAKWGSEVDDALEGTRFGIICLTPDNLASPWIHYEAGALAKTKDALIWTFLHGLTPADVPPPLGKFQHTVAEKGDVLLLLRTINGRLAEVGEEPLPDRLLEENFKLFWPMLEKGLKAAEAISTEGSAQKREGTAVNVRGEGAKLDEVLELARSQERRLLWIEDKLSELGPTQHGSRKKSGDSYYRNISFNVDREEGIDTRVTVQKLVAELERLEPLSIIKVYDFDDRSLVSIDLAEPISMSKAQALLETAARRVNFPLKGWGGAPV